MIILDHPNLENHEIIKPQAGSQTIFSDCIADVAIYGGSAGSGKSYSLLMEPLKFVDEPKVNAIYLRRTFSDIANPGGLWDEAVKLYGKDKFNVTFNKSKMEVLFPSGLSIRFGHINHEDDKYNYKGAQIALIMFDELTSFTETQFWYLMSRNRTDSNVIPYVRATTNPDANSWVKKLIRWWLDDRGFAIEERSGVIRYFIQKDGEYYWADTREELINKFPDELPLSFTFIHATLDDNQALISKDPLYKSKLMNLPKVERERLLGGDWNIVDDAGRVFSAPFYDNMPDGLATIAVLDPAYSGKNHTALAIGGMRNSLIYMRGFVWNRNVIDLYPIILNKLKIYKVGTLFVESNADKGLSARDLYKMRGGHVADYWESENKHIKIIDFLYKKWDIIRFSYDIEPDFLNEILNYVEREEPDDSPDAASACVRLLTTPKRKQNIRFNEVKWK